MSRAAELAARVQAAAEPTPYVVTEQTTTGFVLAYDLADVRWWGPLSRHGMHATFEHRVQVDEAAGTYTVEDYARRIDWRAGMSGPGGAAGPPQPVAGARVGATRGTVRMAAFEKSYGITDDGTPGTITDFSFKSADGTRLIDGAAQQTGLTKRMPASARIGLIVGIVAGAGALLTLIVLGVLALTGAF